MPHEADPSAPAETSPAFAISRRGFALGVVTASSLAMVPRDVMAGQAGVTPCSTVSLLPTFERPEPQANWQVFSAPEVALAFRNHGLQAELLREPITPLGAHYLLIHFDIPQLSAVDYAIEIGGRVRRPMRHTLTALKERPPMTQVVTLQCAGVGRATLRPRSVYVPWSYEALGTYRWTGMPLRSLLEEAGLLDDAVEVLFTGWDSGVDLGVEHAFERSLTIKEAMRDEVMLAWDANGQPLLPQHGFPLRLIVPAWYGMASVKWLRSITVLNEPFEGIQQSKVYRYQQVKGEAGVPVTYKRVDSAMVPPGIPDLITRHRFIAPGRHMVEGKAWSGSGKIVAVEFSSDGGKQWRDAQLVQVAPDDFAWVAWRIEWNAAKTGDHVLMCRARDSVGDIQPIDPNDRFNRQGMGANGAQRITVTVQSGIGVARTRAPSPTGVVVAGATAPPR